MEFDPVKMGKCIVTSSSSNKKDEEAQQPYEKGCHIPHDILIDHIFLKLPIRSLMRFRSASKCWYSIISSSRFANGHFRYRSLSHSCLPTQCLFIQSGHEFYFLCYDDDDHYDDDGGHVDVVSYYGIEGLRRLDCDFEALFDRLYLVGTSNGLVCLLSSSGFFVVWNPITYQYRKIPDPYLLNSWRQWTLSWGFGYVSSVDDYKIVRIIEMPNTLEIIVHVFSLKSNECRKIHHELYRNLFSLGKIMSTLSYANVSLQSFETHRGVLIRESLYWIAADIEIWERKIVSFNLALETFDKFPYLELTSSDVYRDNFLCLMGGCLSTCGVNTRDDLYINIWKGSGRKESICIFRDMNIGSSQDLIGFTRTGKFFIIDRYSKELGLVNPRTSPMNYTPLVWFERECNVDIINHIPSLISPSAIGDLVIAP